MCDLIIKLQLHLFLIYKKKYPKYPKSLTFIKFWDYKITKTYTGYTGTLFWSVTNLIILFNAILLVLWTSFVISWVLLRSSFTFTGVTDLSLEASAVHFDFMDI